MKTKPYFIFLIAVAMLTAQFSFAQTQTKVVSRQWSETVPALDTLLPAVSVMHGDNLFVASSAFTDSTTGVDIILTKMNSEDEGGGADWSVTYSGLGGFHRDEATAICDNSNFIYVGGYTWTDTLFQYAYVTLCFSPDDGTLFWSQTYNGNYAHATDMVTVMVANDDVVVVTGTSEDSVTSWDFVTIAYDANGGSLNWTDRFDNSNGYDAPYSIAIGGDAGHDIIVGGATQTSPTDWNYTTEILDISDGSQISVASLGGGGNGMDRVLDIAVDDTGNVYLTGTVMNSDYDIRTIMVRADTVAWEATYTNTGDDIGYAIAIDDSGNAYISGTKWNSTGHENIVLIKYNHQGVQKWVKSFNGKGNGKDVAYDMALDADRNIFLTGETYNGSDADWITAMYNYNGDSLWSDVFDGVGHGTDLPTKLSLDGDLVYVTGPSFNGTDYSTITMAYGQTAYYKTTDTSLKPTSNLFYPNYGQVWGTDSAYHTEVKYYSHHTYPQNYFTDSTCIYVFSHVDTSATTLDTLHRIDMKFVDAIAPTAHPYSIDRQENGYLNYFLAHTGDRGVTDVHGPKKLLYKNVLDGVDVQYFYNNAGLHYYIIINPGYEYEQLQIKYVGADSVRLTGNGGIKVSSHIGNFTQDQPTICQLDGSGNIDSLNWQPTYYMVDSITAEILLSAYDSDYPVIISCGKQQQLLSASCIDNLCWATFYGGTGRDQASDVTADDQGNFFGVGTTVSIDFPYTSGAISTIYGGNTDAFVVKFDKDNLQTFSTYYGGTNSEYGMAIAVDNANRIYITGITHSNPSGTFMLNQTYNGGGDAYVLCLNQSGNQITYQRYIGGSGVEEGFGIATYDAYVFVGGYTQSSDFPLMDPDANSSANYVQGHISQGANPDGFIVELNGSGSQLWGTYFGAEGEDRIYDIDYDASTNQIFIAGNTATSSYYSVSGSPPCTTCTGFPNLQPTNAFFQANYGGGLYDAFIASFSVLDQSLTWSTFVGGTGEELYRKCNAVHAVPISSTASYVYMVGGTSSTANNSSNSSGTVPFNFGYNYPSFNRSYSGGESDGYIIKFGAAKELLWSTWFGSGTGSGNDSTVIYDVTCFAGHVFVLGHTECDNATSNICSSSTGNDFPLCPGYSLSGSTFFYPSFQNFYSSNPNLWYYNMFFASFDLYNNELLWSTYFGEMDDANTFGMIQLPKFGLTTVYDGYAGTPTPRYLGYGDFTYNANFNVFPYADPDPTLSSSYNEPSNTGESDAVFGKFDFFNPSTGIINTSENTLSDYSLSPNPAKDEISLFSSGKFQKVKIKIYDILGRIVYLREAALGKNHSVHFNISKFAEGMYNIMIEDEIQLRVLKFIKYE